MPLQLLLALPTDLLRLILSSYVARSPLSHITARFVCRRFRDLLPPPLSQETREQARQQASRFCAAAALEGYLNLIKWARANGCPWNEWTCLYAANGGHLEVLQWARANGCPWNEYTCLHAAEGGHLEVLQWAISNGCPYDRYYLCSKAKVKEWIAAGLLKL